MNSGGEIPSNEEIINLLEKIKEMIQNDKFSVFELYNIKDDLQSIVDHDYSLSPEAVKCVILGWWIRRQMGIDPDKCN